MSEWTDGERQLDYVKPAVDVGMMTNDWAAWETALTEFGVTYDHLLKVGGGIHQHRYAVGETVVKINSHRSQLSPAHSTLAGIRLSSPSGRTGSWRSPEGVIVEVVPAVAVGVEVRWRTPDPDGVVRFLEDGLGATRVGGRWRIDTSWFVIDTVADLSRVDDLDGAGFRYITVQVRDLVAEHQRMLDLGYDSGRDPVRLGDTACISFVRAPDGTWVELSQRASLTGPLPELE